MAKLKILIVDDNEHDREMLEVLLAGEGHEVKGARDGESALEAFPAFRPDVMVLDLAMPRLDGLEVMRRLRAHDTLDHCRVVAITARVLGAMTEQLARRSGCSAFLMKPVKPEELLRIVEQPANPTSAGV